MQTKEMLKIYGAKEHNLKNINVEIPKNQLIIITGVSGSGKSSLAFHTLFAQAQRCFVESMSSYLRQYLGKLQKPKVDQITGLSPAIAIAQKVSSVNPRSTVGTTTEIDDYLRLLYAKVGVTYSPISGKEVKKHKVEDVLQALSAYPETQKIYILAPIVPKNQRHLSEELKVLSAQGFTRFLWKLEDKISDILHIEQEETLELPKHAELYLLIDRCQINLQEEDNKIRLRDSIQMAFTQGQGNCVILFLDQKNICLAKKNENFIFFNDRFEADGLNFIEPTESFFSFNSPLGACPSCQATGLGYGYAKNLIFNNPLLSINQGLVSILEQHELKLAKAEFLTAVEQAGFDLNQAYIYWSKQEKNRFWYSENTTSFPGVSKYLENLRKAQHRYTKKNLNWDAYIGKINCLVCHGTRLRIETEYVKIAEKSIGQIQQMTIEEAQFFFKNLNLSAYHQTIAKTILTEINNRLEYLIDVGLSYLQLSRASNTLSGGESQRIQLASNLGNGLMNTLYILDEPSIGLHPQDTQRLLKVLRALQALGNTVILVEHDPDLMRAADYIIDLGPLAGVQGGEVVFQGTVEALLKDAKSLTAKYLNQPDQVAGNLKKRASTGNLYFEGVYARALKGFAVTLPLNMFTVVSGVSGSGKSSLVEEVIYYGVQQKLEGIDKTKILCQNIHGDFHLLKEVLWIDQNPIGRSSRSNPAMYIGAFDLIRSLYATQAKKMGKAFTMSHFSFNSPGGRCENCKGEGHLTIEMQFLADVSILCEVCHGKRYEKEILEILYQGKNIYEVLTLSIAQATDFFAKENPIVSKLSALKEVGLGYLPLGQSSSTLSGGEAQRVKLATFLVEDPKKTLPTLFLFDEPTTGLHLKDIEILLHCFQKLLDLGHTIVAIEHHTSMIAAADWVLDLGPKSGEQGGELVFQGTVEDLKKSETSVTGKYL